jgi:hypothetical protein
MQRLSYGSYLTSSWGTHQASCSTVRWRLRGTSAHLRAGPTHRYIVGVKETTPLWRPAEWDFCDHCGTSVGTVLIHPDGHHYADDGDFYCADCWESGFLAG